MLELDIPWGNIWIRKEERIKTHRKYGFPEEWNWTHGIAQGKYINFGVDQLPSEEDGYTNAFLPVDRFNYLVNIMYGGDAGYKIAADIANEDIYPFFVLGPKTANVKRRADKANWGLQTTRWERDQMGSGWLANAIKNLRRTMYETDVTPGQFMELMHDAKFREDEVTHAIKRDTRFVRKVSDRMQAWILQHPKVNDMIRDRVQGIAGADELVFEEVNGERKAKKRKDGSFETVHIEGTIEKDSKDMKKYIPGLFHLFERRKMQAFEGDNTYELRELRNRYRDPQAPFTKDDDRRMMALDRLAEPFTGYRTGNQTILDHAAGVNVNEESPEREGLVEDVLGNPQSPVHKKIDRLIAVETHRAIELNRPEMSRAPLLTADGFEEMIKVVGGEHKAAISITKVNDPFIALGLLTKLPMKLLQPDVHARQEQRKARSSWRDALNFGQKENPGNTGVIPLIAPYLMEELEVTMGNSETAGVIRKAADALKDNNLDNTRNTLTEIIEDPVHLDAMRTLAILFDRGATDRTGNVKNLESAIIEVVNNLDGRPDKLLYLLTLGSTLRAYQGVASRMPKEFNKKLDPADDAGMMAIAGRHAKGLERFIYETITRHYLEKDKYAFLVNADESCSEDRYKEFAFVLEWIAREAPDVFEDPRSNGTRPARSASLTTAERIRRLMSDQNIGFTSETYDLNMVDLIGSARKTLRPDYIPGTGQALQRANDSGTMVNVIDSATGQPVIDPRTRTREVENKYGVPNHEGVTKAYDAIGDHIYTVVANTLRNKISPFEHRPAPGYVRAGGVDTMIAYLEDNRDVIGIGLNHFDSPQLVKLTEESLIPKLDAAIARVDELVGAYHTADNPSNKQLRVSFLLTVAGEIKSRLKNCVEIDPKLSLDVEGKIKELTRLIPEQALVRTEAVSYTNMATLPQRRVVAPTVQQPAQATA